MKKESDKKKAEKTVVATHRKARQAYEILETFEAGMRLLGAEVKSLRTGKASLDGCFGRADGGELYLFNFYIAPYHYAHVDVPEPRRARKLLLRKTEISRIMGKLQGKGLTLVPLEVYFKHGWAKVGLAIARGKRGPDRREDLRKQAVAREAERSFKGKYKS